MSITASTGSGGAMMLGITLDGAPRRWPWRRGAPDHLNLSQAICLVGAGAVTVSAIAKRRLTAIGRRSRDGSCLLFQSPGLPEDLL